MGLEIDRGAGMAGGAGRRVSLTMIVKDEARNLPACLESVADLVNEIVVVDTGSSDHTRDVARGFGATVVEFHWVDHFAAARNAALDHASGDWILWLDADDRLDAANRERLRRLLNGLGDEHAGYLMRQVNSVATAPGERVVFDRVHLFPRRPDVRWERRVHEQILPSLERTGAQIVPTDVAFDHIGYHDPETHRRKAERNLRLLRLELAERPDDGFTLFHLAWTLHLLGRIDEALPVWPEALARSSPTASYLRKLYSLWTRDTQAIGRSDEALAICREGRRRLPDDDELTFLEALLLRQRQDPAGAEALLRRLIAGPGGASLSHGDNPGLRGHLSRHHLAEICREQGRDAEAESHWRAAAEQAPHFAPAWRGLAELYLAHGLTEPAREAITRLSCCEGAAAEAATLRARLPGTADVGAGSPSEPKNREIRPPIPSPQVPQGERTPPRGADLGDPPARAAGRVGPPPVLPPPPGAAEALARAEQAMASGRVGEAEAIYQSLLDEDHEPGLMAYRLGTIADSRGDFEAAWRLHRRAVEADPGIAAWIAPPEAPHRLWVTARDYEVEPAPACPVCGGSDREPIRVVNCLANHSAPLAIDPVRRWVRCLGCGHGMADPRPSPEMLALARLEPPPAHLTHWDYQALQQAGAIIARLAERRPDGRLLDVGAGIGLLTAAAIEFGYEVTALEVNPTFEPMIRTFGATFLQGDLLEIDLGDRRFDLALLGNVLEHLPDPRQGLKRIADVVEPGGLVWVSTPNLDGAWTRALGHRDPRWHAAEHLHFFTKSGLHRLMLDCNLKPLEYRLSERSIGCGETIAERC